jgi:predicted small secreted protein
MIKKAISLLLATVFLSGAVMSLTGCNTMEGAGKDMQQGGKALSNEAQKDK